jgi:rhodanese-related sulfurtransferase
MLNITVEELKQRLNNQETLNVIDVREKEEYDDVNIGAQLIPLSQLRQMDADAIEHLKNQEVIVHCRSGKRSMEACLLLETMGFSKTVNVTGGIMAWLEKYGQEKVK